MLSAPVIVRCSAGVKKDLNSDFFYWSFLVNSDMWIWTANKSPHDLGVCPKTNFLRSWREKNTDFRAIRTAITPVNAGDTSRPHEKLNSAGPWESIIHLEIFYLGVMQVYAVHGQLLRIFQKLGVCLGWSHSPERTGGDIRHQSRFTPDNPVIVTHIGLWVQWGLFSCRNYITVYYKNTSLVNGRDRHQFTLCMRTHIFLIRVQSLDLDSQQVTINQFTIIISTFIWSITLFEIFFKAPNVYWEQTHTISKSKSKASQILQHSTAYELKLVYFVCHDIRGWVILDFAEILIWKFEETGYCANTSTISV